MVWSGGATPATAANSFNAPGTYTVTVTGTNGCTSTTSITITQNTTAPTAGITNNSGTTIDNHELYIDIALKISKDVEFIYARIHLVRTDENIGTTKSV